MYNGISSVRISYFPVALSSHSRLGFVLGYYSIRQNQMAARGVGDWRMALRGVAIPIDVTPHKGYSILSSPVHSSRVHQISGILGNAAHSVLGYA